MCDNNRKKRTDDAGDVKAEADQVWCGFWTGNRSGRPTAAVVLAEAEFGQDTLADVCQECRAAEGGTRSRCTYERGRMCVVASRSGHTPGDPTLDAALSCRVRFRPTRAAVSSTGARTSTVRVPV